MVEQRKHSNKLGLLAVSLVVVLLTSIFAARGMMAGWEVSLFRVVNNLPDAQRPLWLVATGMGSVFFLFGLTLFLIFFKYYRTAVRLFSLSVIALLTSEAMKVLVDRPRPVALLSDVHVRQLMVGNGYPSSHTALAVVMACTVVTLLPRRARWVACVWIGLVAVSRLYLGVHAPLDVIGGCAIGLLVVHASSLGKGKLRLVTKITGLELAKPNAKA